MSGEILVCGVPNNVGNVECLWPFKDVTVYGEGKLGQISLAEALELAIKPWNEVCGIRLAMTPNHKTAHIAATPRPIDGSGNILAQCELPCGFFGNRWQQLKLTADSSELFVIAENPPAGRIDVVRTLTHEIGHGLGVGHIAAGNLMAPVYSTTIRLPQNGDIVEVRARYGPPSPVAVPPAAPGPSPAPSPSGDPIIMLDEKGRRFQWVGWQLIK